MVSPGIRIETTNSDLERDLIDFASKSAIRAGEFDHDFADLLEEQVRNAILRGTGIGEIAYADRSTAEEIKGFRLLRAETIRPILGQGRPSSYGRMITRSFARSGATSARHRRQQRARRPVTSSSITSSRGYIGAAIATASVISSVNVIKLLEVWYLEGMFLYDTKFAKPIFAGLIAGLIMETLTYFLKGYGLVLAASIIGGLAFVLIILVLGISKEKEI